MRTALPTALPRDQPFDYLLLSDRLKNYSAARDKISRMLNRQDIIRVKKGLYVPGPALALHEVDPLVLSGMVFGPSYVSFEKALEIHGLIPERVVEITCATTKRHKLFETPAGRFSYQPVPRQVYPLGVAIASAPGGNYLLASPEKALCDRAARTTHMSRIADVAAWLFDDIRVDEMALRQLSVTDMQAIATAYARLPVRLLARWLAHRQSNRGNS
jgi:predicted transcriptional regulator of viral defense system